MTLTAFRGWHIPWGGQPKIVANTALGGRWASTWTLCIISTVCYCDEWFRVVTVATTLINCGIRVEGPTVVHFTRYHPCSYQYVRPPVHCLASLSTRDGSISLGFKFAASSGERQLPIPSYRCLFLWYNSLYCSSVSFSAAGRLASFPAPTEAMNLQSNAANLSPLPTCAVPRMTAGPVTGADPSWRSEMRWLVVVGIVVFGMMWGHIGVGWNVKVIIAPGGVHTALVDRYMQSLHQCRIVDCWIPWLVLMTRRCSDIVTYKAGL